ncbi:MAG: restriction endonuclease [Luteimonas sp.]|nr:restriction endonuclease [Luteimonas sp.]
MGAVSHWVVAILVGLLVGGAGTFYFRGYRMRRDETAAGIVALSGVSWRVFIHMVLDALARRGYERVVDQEDASGDRDFTLEKDRRHWLLSCKHGSAFVLGKPDVNQLANDINMKGAAGGFLVTQGRITEDARPVAGLQGIELLDGPALWPELRGFIPAEQLASIRAKAAERARQGSLLSWLAALVAGIAVFLALPEPSAQASQAQGHAAGQPTTPVAAPAVVADEPLANNLPPPLSVEEQRQTLVKAIATLPDVDRVLWSSESTLQVFLLRIDGDAFERICPLVERHDDLAASRIQLTPPAGSDALVRFRQCRSY